MTNYEAASPKHYDSFSEVLEMEKFQTIIIGGGHNGLTAAAYLAKAGKQVLVLERRHILGGAAVVAWFDKRVVNETGVDGGAQLINFLGWRLKFTLTGRIPNYVLAMAVGVLAVIIVAVSNS